MNLAFGAWGRDPSLRERITAVVPEATFAEVAPISRAFAPMVGEGAFDISEMALFTFLIAKAHSKPLVLLPVVAASRFQEAALLCRDGDATIAGPADLGGKRIGVRAYSQTTGAWLRGTLSDAFGLSPGHSRWVTFEDAHVAGYADPPWCERASGDMMTMLRDGDLDAVIVGNDVPDDRGLRTVFPDPAAAGEAFRARHGFVPVNHMLCVRRAVMEQNPAAVERIVAATGKAVAREWLTPVIELAIRFAVEQDLLEKPMSVDEVWQ